jgi:hypothetical protein
MTRQLWAKSTDTFVPAQSILDNKEDLPSTHACASPAIERGTSPFEFVYIERANSLSKSSPCLHPTPIWYLASRLYIRAPSRQMRRGIDLLRLPLRAAATIRRDVNTPAGTGLTYVASRLRSRAGFASEADGYQRGDEMALSRGSISSSRSLQPQILLLR